MSSPARVFEKGAYYHVYNRGNHRQPVYYDDADFQYFMDKLSSNCNKYSVSIHAYCIMKNHYHLLLRQVGETGITPTMLATAVSYVKYFNKRYDTVGRLFQERFRAVSILSDEQLLYISKYIHLNPSEFMDHEKYPWSSYSSYLNNHLDSYCDPGPILEILAEMGENYRNFATTIPGMFHLTTPGVKRAVRGE